MKLQYSLKKSGKYIYFLSTAQPPPLSDLLPHQSFNLLMCIWTDALLHSDWSWNRPSGKPPAPRSPNCSAYVAIDQAPVSAHHICAQTSVALIWPTVTDDRASKGWYRWWMNESTLRCIPSLSVFRWAEQGVIITLQYLYSLSSSREHSALIK